MPVLCVIVEPEPYGVIADRIDGENGHVALAAHRLAFRFGMALALRRRDWSHRSSSAGRLKAEPSSKVT